MSRSSAPASVICARADRTPVNRQLWTAYQRLILDEGGQGMGNRREQKRRQRQRNPEILKARAHEYYLRHRQKYIAASRRWKSAHPGYASNYYQNWKNTPAGQRNLMLKSLRLTTNAPESLVRACLANRQLREELHRECR